MNSILEVGKGLPPGLWLPRAEEPTEIYSRTTFNHKNHDFADLLDYGAFVTALAMFDAERSGRICLMPNLKDFDSLFEAGYGLSEKNVKLNGGIKKIQLALGFYPEGYTPVKEQLITRFKWLYEYALPLAEGDEAVKHMSMEDIINWGSARRLTPSTKICYPALNGDTSNLRMLLGIDKRLTHKSLSIV